MCLFLTVGVLPQQREGLVKALRAARLEVVDQPNPFVRERFAPGRVLLLVTHGGCSCQLRLLPRPERITDPRARRVEELTPRQRARLLEQPAKTPRPNVALDALKATLTAFSPLEVLHHEVRGDPTTEPVPEGLRSEPYPTTTNAPPARTGEASGRRKRRR